MAKMRESARTKIEKLKGPLKPLASRLFSTMDQGFFLFNVCECKLDYLAEALIHAIEARNPLALANNARSLVEHLAALVAIVKELERLEKNLRGQGNEEAMNEAMGRAERFIHRAYYGKSPKLTDDENQQAFHVNDYLEALKQEVADIEEVYDFLCEYVHPNHGSNLLVSTGALGSGRLNPPEEYHRETLDRLRRYCSHCMLFLKQRGIEYASVFMRLHDLLELCFIQGAKITNVFSVKASNPEGDGKSRETAFFFSKARTATEAINLSYRFLEKEGYEVQRRENRGVADGFVYDVYSTDKGTVWFKIPTVKL
jgi:hypothetical protein